MDIFVTGDTHREHDFAKLEFFAKRNPQLTKNDYVIIAGDFGGVWDGSREERFWPLRSPSMM